MTNDFDLKGKAREPKEFWIARIDGDTACYIYDDEIGAENRILSGIKLPPHWLGRNPYHIHLIEYSAYANLRRQVSIYEKALEKITAPYKDIGLGCYHEEIARAALEEGRK